MRGGGKDQSRRPDYVGLKGKGRNWDLNTKEGGRKEKKRGKKKNAKNWRKQGSTRRKERAPPGGRKPTPTWSSLGGKKTGRRISQTKPAKGGDPVKVRKKDENSPGHQSGRGKLTRVRSPINFA